MFDHSVYTKCEKGWVFAKTKPQSIIIITALHWSWRIRVDTVNTTVC